MSQTKSVDHIHSLISQAAEAKGTAPLAAMQLTQAAVNAANALAAVARLPPAPPPLQQ